MMRWWQKIRDYFFPHARNRYRPKFFSASSLALIVLSVIVLEGAYLTDVKLVFPKTGFLASVLPATLLDLTNADRHANGAPVVAENPLLDHAANLAAEDMATKGYFAHVSPSGTTPWDWLGDVGYDYTYAGENLAVNFSDSDAVEEAWMNSASHRANIVKSQYTEVGFGTAEGQYQGEQTTFVVTFFASPAQVPAKPAPAAIPAPAASSSAPVAVATPSTTPAVLGAATPAPSVIDRVLASPTRFAESAAALLFALVALLMTIAIIAHARLAKIPHASIFAGGALLLALSAGSLFLDRGIAGQVIIPADTESASAVSALAH